MIYLTLFLEFFKIGLFTFGGGYAMIPLISEVVMKYGWMSEDKFIDLIALCESTPGPIAINMATFVGSSQGGILGSALATLGVVLPSFIIILLIASILKNFINNKYVQMALKGIKAVIIGLILATGITLTLGVIGFNDLKFNFDLTSAIILGILVIIYFIVTKGFKKKMNAIMIILTSAILGLIICLIL